MTAGASNVGAFFPIKAMVVRWLRVKCEFCCSESKTVNCYLQRVNVEGYYMVHGVKIIIDQSRGVSESRI